MPKSKQRITEADEHNSDGEVEQPKRKRTKLEKPAGKTSKESEGDAVPGGGARDGNGAMYWELSNNRRVTLSEFRGKRMIDLREFYIRDDQAMPGKKGISFPVEQFGTLVTALPHIEKALREAGEELPRPSYDETEVEAKPKPKPKPKKEVVSDKKKNFEATSDEEEAEE